jgi:hypothetical protein
MWYIYSMHKKTNIFIWKMIQKNNLINMYSPPYSWYLLWKAFAQGKVVGFYVFFLFGPLWKFVFMLEFVFFILTQNGGCCIYLYLFFRMMVEVPFVKGKNDILKVHVGNKKFTTKFSLKIICNCFRNKYCRPLQWNNIFNNRRGNNIRIFKDVDDSIDQIVVDMDK